ncbi:MAG: hypothetical protein FWD06_02635 [Oscillospiraceae bacterium]|nr:hypothetical protein [Oscillospiraceae bacterium]
MKRTLAILLAVVLGVGIGVIATSAASATKLAFNVARHGQDWPSCCCEGADMSPTLSAAIRNVTELQAHLASYDSIDFNIDRHDDAFFQNSFLLIANFWDTHSGHPYTVDAVWSNGHVEITRHELKPDDNVLGALEYIFFLIEVCNSYVPSQFFLVLDGDHVATSPPPTMPPSVCPENPNASTCTCNDTPPIVEPPIDWVNALGIVGVVLLAVANAVAIFFFVRTMFFT